MIRLSPSLRTQYYVGPSFLRRFAPQELYALPYTTLSPNDKAVAVAANAILRGAEFFATLRSVRMPLLRKNEPTP